MPGVDEEEQDDKAARLEALLEEFREPEEPPRKNKTGPIWYLVALILGLGGCWLALQATEGGVPDATATTAGPMKPAKVADRSAYYTKLTITDAEADYRERCKKGMTAKEVRWIAEDFVQADLADGTGGLPSQVREAEELLRQTAGWTEWAEDGEPPSDLTEKVTASLKSKGLLLAARQQQWYVGALSDGLRLDRDQRKEAYESGRRFVEELGAGFPSPAEPDGEAEGGGPEEEPPGIGDELLNPAQWLQNQRCAPWEMCDLRPDQRAIVEVAGARGAAIRDDASQPIRNAAVVFPFTEDQDKRIPEDDLSGLLGSLHPAQLKMLLLIEPGMATMALEALGKDSE